MKEHEARAFQSPSLRGSGRFAGGGAQRVRGEGCGVSIPFIAGQWSLPHWDGSPKGFSSRFNPLHCGAVVASKGHSPTCTRRHFCFNPLHCGAVVASRRCFFRPPHGGRRFNPLHCGAVVASSVRSGKRRHGRSFNPLHCGAVVASTTPPNTAPTAPCRFQSPSLRGSGRFGVHGAGVDEGAAHVSIPFIAGQWSLPVEPSGVSNPSVKFQSPSLRGSGRFQANGPTLTSMLKGFNPLHCGAVVASFGAGSDRR